MSGFMSRSSRSSSSSSSGSCGGGSSNSYYSYSMQSSSGGGSSGMNAMNAMNTMGEMSAMRGMCEMNALAAGQMSGMNALAAGQMSGMNVMTGPVGHVSTLMPTVCGGAGACGASGTSGASFSQSSFTVSGGMLPAEASMIGGEMRAMHNLNGHMASHLGNVHSLEGGTTKVVKVTKVYEETTPTISCDRSAFFSSSTRTQSHF